MASNTSPEVRSILSHTLDLTTALSNDSLGVAGILLSKELICREVHWKMLTINPYTPREKAAILVEAVTNTIEIAPMKFSTFLEILSEQVCAKEVVERLRSTYESLLNQGDDSGSDESGDIHVHVANDIEVLECQFDSLRTRIISELSAKHELSVRILLDSLTSLPLSLKREYASSLEKKIPTMSGETQVDELFTHLNPLLSFIDYGLIEYLIKKFGSDALKKDMLFYCSKMKLFMKETTIQDLIDHLPGQTEIPPKFSLLEAKLGWNASKCTLEQINTIRKRYCSEVRLSEIIFHLIAIVDSYGGGGTGRGQVKKYGTRTLIKASENGDIESVKRLLETGSLRDDNETSVLMAASKNGHGGVIALLLDHGVRVNILDKNGRSALMIASQHGHVQVVQLLLQRGAQPNLKDNNGMSSLMMASQNGHHDIIQLLLEHDTPINLPNNNGWTAVMLACSNNHIKVVQTLLKNGAHVERKFLTQLSQIRHQHVLEVLNKHLGTAPSILLQPKDQYISRYGCKVTLSITATATDGKLTYEWFKDGETISPEVYPYLEQFHTPNLVITSFMPEYEGKYKCRVSNDCGTVDSSEAKLCVMVENTLLLCCGQVDSRGGTIIGAGIEIQIPKGALKPGEHTTIAVHASIKSPSIQSNFHLISPIFHIKCVPHIQFKRDITLTIEHFAQLKTKSDLDDIVFLISKKGEEFHQSEQLKCHIESSHAKVNVAHFCEVTLGTKSDPNYRYSMLVALPKNRHSWRQWVWAYFSISLDSKTYKQAFETFLDKFLDHPFLPVEETSIEPISDEIVLMIDAHNNEYRIHPSHKPPKILKQKVESVNNDSDAYPPKIRLDICLLTPPRFPFMCDVPVKGIRDISSFTLRADYELEPLAITKPQDSNYLDQRMPSAAAPVPKPRRRPVTVNSSTRCDHSYLGTLLNQLKEHAIKWKDIGTDLGFRPGELNNIQGAPNHQNTAPQSFLRAMLSEWLEWAPGDGRGSDQYATLEALKDAVSKAGLGRTAENLTINITPPTVAEGAP